MPYDPNTRVDDVDPFEGVNVTKTFDTWLVVKELEQPPRFAAYSRDGKSRVGPFASEKEAITAGSNQYTVIDKENL